MKTYTITIIGPVGISYWVPLDPAEAPQDAIARLSAEDPKSLAEAMKKCAVYVLENVERELTFSDGDEHNQLVWDYYLSFEQRLALEFNAPDAVGEPGVELRADALASRHYPFEAESLDDAIAQFASLTAKELNVPHWEVWGIDLEAEVLVWNEPYEVDERWLVDMASHLEVSFQYAPRS